MRHDQYVAWLRARAQANYRGEGWRLPFQAWERLWADQWHRRGRGKHDLMLVRKNWHAAWSERNCHLVTRDQFHARQQLMKVENGTIAPEYRSRYAKHLKT